MKRWIKYIKPYLPAFILGPICMIVEVLGEVWMPKLLAILINMAEEPEKYGELTEWRSIGIGGLMILIALLMMGGGVGGSYFGAKASVNFAADLRKDIFTKVQKFSFANIDKFSTGSIVTRTTNDVNQLQGFCNMLLRMALRSPGMMIGGLIMAISIKPSLSVVFAVTMPLMIVTIGIVIVMGFPLFQNMQTKVDALNSTVQENVTNVRVVKSFVRKLCCICRNDKLDRSCNSAYRKTLRWTRYYENDSAFNYVRCIVYDNIRYTLPFIYCGGNSDLCNNRILWNDSIYRYYVCKEEHAS